MKTNYELRYASHPEDAKHYDTTRLRRDFLIEKVFAKDEVNMVYSDVRPYGRGWCNACRRVSEAGGYSTR